MSQIASVLRLSDCSIMPSALLAIRAAIGSPSAESGELSDVDIPQSNRKRLAIVGPPGALEPVDSRTSPRDSVPPGAVPSPTGPTRAGHLSARSADRMSNV